ncbi:MAG: hypothetical protein MUO63_07145 [Desulfobulbaceae bacterium]|nr:hypothetical protein [Desulfobulbaceae bacterium]
MNARNNGKISARIAWELATNIVVAMFFFYFAWIYANEFYSTLRVSALLILIKESCDITFYLCRKFPQKVSFSFISWVAALGGTLTPLLLRPYGNYDFLVGSIIQYVGLSLQIVAILSLNRSFGIVPANRGIKTGGMYRVVRHPLYLTYFISLIGFFVNNFSFYNASILFANIIFQVVRVFKEEEFLIQDTDYMNYAEKTKWRIVPYMF